MKTRKIFASLLILTLLFSLASCSRHDVNWNSVYQAGTDHQINVESAINSYMTEADNGFYILDGLYIYYMDKNTLEYTVLCQKPDCLHDKETDPYQKSKCEGFVGYAQSIFYYDKFLYIVKGDNNKKNPSNSVYKYNLNGTLVKKMFDLPPTVNYILQHKGYLIYIYRDLTGYASDKWGVYKVEKVSLIDKKKESIYTCPFKDDASSYMGSLLAYRNMLYFREYGIDRNNKFTERDVFYNLENNSVNYVCPEDASITDPIIYKDSVVYRLWYYDDTNYKGNQIYQADLNGTNQKELFTLKYSNSFFKWDGKYFYESNAISFLKKEVPFQSVYVYDEHFKLICEFNFQNIDGVDFSNDIFFDMKITNDYLLFKTSQNKNGNYIICVNKSELASGKVTPKIAFSKSVEYANTELRS